MPEPHDDWLADLPRDLRAAMRVRVRGEVPATSRYAHARRGERAGRGRSALGACIGASARPRGRPARLRSPTPAPELAGQIAGVRKTCGPVIGERGSMATWRVGVAAVAHGRPSRPGAARESRDRAASPLLARANRSSCARRMRRWCPPEGIGAYGQVARYSRSGEHRPFQGGARADVEPLRRIDSPPQMIAKRSPAAGLDQRPVRQPC